MIKIIFDSPLMYADSITFRTDDKQEALKQYYHWWSGYRKDEDYANSMIIDIIFLD